MKYFYIFTFDSQVFELEFTKERFNNALQSWRRDEIILIGGSEDDFETAISTKAISMISRNKKNVVAEGKKK